LSLGYNQIPEPKVVTPNEAAYGKIPRSRYGRFVPSGIVAPLKFKVVTHGTTKPIRASGEKTLTYIAK